MSDKKSSSVEELLRQALDSTTLTPTGRGGGGCISEGTAYMVDWGTVFVKSNRKKNAKLMFDGEAAGLEAIGATNTLRVPRPLACVSNPQGGALLALEFLDLKSLRSCQGQMGQQLARLHMHNLEHLERQERRSFRVGGGSENVGADSVAPVTEFGFSVPTCCGYLAMLNEWRADWPTFYSRNRLEPQIKMIEKNHGDRELMELWSALRLQLPTLLATSKPVRPSLLHGDLWSGNAAETTTGPVAFDAAAFYGHHEFDLAIGRMFGGFNKTFHTEYHRLIPREEPGFEIRGRLYELFHHLNHWNHFGGSGYRSSSLQLMRGLIK